MPQSGLAAFLDEDERAKASRDDVRDVGSDDEAAPLVFEPHVGAKSNRQNAQNKSENGEENEQNLLQLRHFFHREFEPTFVARFRRLFVRNVKIPCESMIILQTLTVILP